MRQAVLIDREKIILRDVPEPSVREKQVLIRVKRIGICGSDIHAYYGKHPFISFPIVQGHEFSGEVVAAGDKVAMFKPGDRVTVRPQLTCGQCYHCTHGDYHICDNLKVIGCQADGAAQELFAVDEKLVVKLPPEISFDFGAMVEPLAVGVHAVLKLGNLTGKRVLILGGGPIGLLTAQAARALGAENIIITDILDYRLEIARQCGLENTVNPRRSNLEEEILKHFGPNKADGIIECVGSEETANLAIHLSRKGSSIVIVGVFGSIPRVELGLVQDRELKLVGSLMYKEEDYHLAIGLLEKGKVNLQPLITKHFKFADYPATYKYIDDNKDKTMKVLIDLDL